MGLRGLIMNWTARISLTLETVATLFSFAGPPTAKAQEKKPNVIFILADNVGYGDLGPYGGGSEGLKMTVSPIHLRFDRVSGMGVETSRPENNSGESGQIVPFA
jgi:hypothetical protein